MRPYTSFHLPAEVSNSLITDKPLDIPALLKHAHHPQAGGMVLFSGEVRNHNAGKAVKFLEYEAEISIGNLLINEIVGMASQKWNLNFGLCMHRIGRLQVGESAVIVITSHTHRKEAYEANQYIIDRVKHETPIWKKEYYEDGTYSWGGSCNCYEA
jgi:molybdopterin synthase catalytic subunit